MKLHNGGVTMEEAEEEYQRCYGETLAGASVARPNRSHIVLPLLGRRHRTPLRTWRVPRPGLKVRNAVAYKKECSTPCSHTASSTWPDPSTQVQANEANGTLVWLMAGLDEGMGKEAEVDLAEA